MPAKKASTATVMDVSRPGKTPPSSSGVPIIVTHRPIMKDPMVVDESKDADKPADTPPAKTGKTIRIEPISHDDEPEPVQTKTAPKPAAKSDPKPAAADDSLKIIPEGKPDTAVDKSDQPAEEPTEDTAEAPKPEEAEPTPEPAPADATTSAEATEPAPTAEPAEPTAAAPDEAKAETKPAAGDSFQLEEDPDEEDQSDPSKHPMDEAQQKADKEAAEKAAAFEKQVDSQTYFLPINAVEKRRVRHILLGALLLVVVLAIAGVVWSQSTGLLTIPGL